MLKTEDKFMEQLAAMDTAEEEILQASVVNSSNGF